MDKIFFLARREKIWFWSLLTIALTIWIGVIFFRQDVKATADEITHIKQIQFFAKGKYELTGKLTNIPAYHAVVAILIKPFGRPSSEHIHIVSFLLALISIWAFYLVSKRLHQENSYLRTLQYVFLPISFLYFPLVYVDIFSLFLVLMAFYFSLKKRHSLAALFSLFSIVTRQNNIVWAAFIFAHSYIEENGFSLSKKAITAHLKKSIGHIAVFIAFMLFIFINGSIAMGDKENQQVGFFMGNIYFFLFTITILFLPIITLTLTKIKRLRADKYLLCSIGAGTILAAAFLFFRPSLHLYNFEPNFLRNIILHLAYGKYAIFYAITIIIGTIALFQMKFEKKYVILFPFIILSLIPSFLIEQRYYIVPIAFILLFRKNLNAASEIVLAIYFSAISLLFVFMFLGMGIFL